MNEQILAEITEFCRSRGLAESTFGRRAVNDGKLASRLRNGGRITTETLDRIRTFMSHSAGSAPAKRRVMFEAIGPIDPAGGCVAGDAVAPAGNDDPQRNFRFFDNRQKYLLFVEHLLGEMGDRKPRFAGARQHPSASRRRCACSMPASATAPCSARVMRSMHDKYPTMPFYIVAKEISLEDIRLTLQKMADRFIEHPSSVIVLTNLAYAEAPWLTVKSVSAATSMVWKEVALDGNTAHAFEQQITGLEGFLGENWKAKVSPKSGNPVYERPVVLVLYRNDHKFLLDQVIPKPGGTVADYDLVIASQPYRARASARLQGQARAGAAGQGARSGRTHDRHPFARQRSGHGDHQPASGRRTIRSRTTGTNC